MYTIDVSFESGQSSDDIPLSDVENILEKTLKALDVKEGELSVTFVSAERIRTLNREYRFKDESTDILSFVANEGEFGGIETPVLGDLVISVDDLKENCDYFSVEMSEELIRLLVHGTLHLLGWDHTTNDQSEPMLVMQEKVVTAIQKERG